MLFGANHVIPSGFCLSRIIFYNPAIPSGLKLRNISKLSRVGLQPAKTVLSKKVRLQA